MSVSKMEILKITLSIILYTFPYKVSGEFYFTKLHQKLTTLNETSCTILTLLEPIHKSTVLHERTESLTEVNTYPAVNQPEGEITQSHTFKPQEFIIEIFSNNQSIAYTHIDKLCTSKSTLEPLTSRIGLPLPSKASTPSTPQVIKLIDGGDPSNRIDVVFMGDGYTLGHKDQFFNDITRLTRDTFQSVTFRNYLPLFNIWAIFVPSKDPGIGYNGKAKNTAFKLYRNSGLLRGIFSGNHKYARQVCKLTGPSGCDYPSLIANDDYYGGLGGEFAISTRSFRTGAVVLRHELGHNFARVGEEYDSGDVYTGANSAGTLRNIKWQHWLTNNHKNASTSIIKEERMTYRILAYPTNDLDKSPLTFSFNSDGTYSRWYLFVSVTGAGEEDSLGFFLDGAPLTWKSRGFDDKEFYDWFGNQGLSKGRHNLTIMSLKSESKTTRKIARMVGSVNFYEYGNEDEFRFQGDVISAYPTWDSRKRKSFRPTNAGCLMRNMTHDHFCSVCKEEIWLQFFKRISLIDSLEIEETWNWDGLTRNVTLRTLELGQFRKVGGEVEGEGVEIKWILEDQVLEGFNGQLGIACGKGRWRVQVGFTTPEVRNDPKGFLSDVRYFNVL